MNIPSSLLRTMDTYEVEFDDDHKVKVSVVDQGCCLLEEKLSELRSLLSVGVIGLDFKDDDPYVLVLCVGSRCLIIHSAKRDMLSDQLTTLLREETICFVGLGMPNILNKLNGRISTLAADCKSGVEVGYLAARVLKKPQLFQSKGLAELAGEVGIDVKALPAAESSGNTFSDSWKKMLYSDEQIKRTVYNAYLSYAIADKALAGPKPRRI